MNNWFDMFDNIVVQNRGAFYVLTSCGFAETQDSASAFLCVTVFSAKTIGETLARRACALKPGCLVCTFHFLNCGGYVFRLHELSRTLGSDGLI